MSNNRNKTATAFPTSRIFLTGLAGGQNCVRAQIKVGNGTPNQYYISGETQGQQIFRTQYDLAVDGTEYVLAAGAGQGSYTFNVFEGPFDCGPTTDVPSHAIFAATYRDLRKFENRQITVVIPLTNATTNQNTQARAQFSGMIVAATTRQVMDGSTYFIVTSVQTMGVWR